MLALLLQFSAEQSVWVSMAIAATPVLLLGIASEYADYLSRRQERNGKP